LIVHQANPAKDSPVTHSKESKDICIVVDSLPEEARQYVRDMVYRVAGVLGNSGAEKKSKRKLRTRAALGLLSWLVIGACAVSGATPDLPPIVIAKTQKTSRNSAAASSSDEDDDVPHVKRAA